MCYVRAIEFIQSVCSHVYKKKHREALSFFCLQHSRLHICIGPDALAYDPRPALPLEREVHDFEVHRQGRHAAGHTFTGPWGLLCVFESVCICFCVWARVLGVYAYGVWSCR